MERYLSRLPKRQKQDDGTAQQPGLAAGQHPPQTIITWNANSIKLRAERRDCAGIVQLLDRICATALFIQETRTLCGDQAACEVQLRKAGLSSHRFYWSSHPSKRYSGTACIVHTDHLPLRVTYSLNPHMPPGAPSYPNKSDTPDQQGRVIVLEYERCFILNLYVPMCSWYAEGRATRDIWDLRLMAAVQAMQQLKPVVLVGDLNVCHQPLDVSHPSFFAAAKKPGNVGGSQPCLPGQPGYTDLERRRFGELLSSCQMVDTFRALHPGAPRLTWGYSQNLEVGIYKGKYMGLDYVLVPRSFWEEGRVVTSEVCGQEACFGSDHCAAYCTLEWAEPAGGGDR